MSCDFERTHEGISREIDKSAGAACSFSEEVSVVHTRLARMLGRELADSSAKVSSIERELAAAQASLSEEHRLNAALVSDLQAAQARIAELERDVKQWSSDALYLSDSVVTHKVRIAELSANQCEREPAAWRSYVTGAGKYFLHEYQSMPSDVPLYCKSK